MKQIFYSPSCISCGSYFVNSSMFCSHCFLRLKKVQGLNLKQSSADILTAQHFFMFEWQVSENHSALAELIYRLKSDRGAQAWNFYSEQIIKAQHKILNWSDYTAIIPIPSSRKSSVHSRLFAESLASLTGLPVKDALYKLPGLVSQKRLSAEQRHSRSAFRRCANNTEHFTKYILVDDVLTTGESAQQCHKALGEDGDSVVLTLLYRAKKTKQG